MKHLFGPFPVEKLQPMIEADAEKWHHFGVIVRKVIESMIARYAYIHSDAQGGMIKAEFDDFIYTEDDFEEFSYYPRNFYATCEEVFIQAAASSGQV